MIVNMQTIMGTVLVNLAEKESSVWKKVYKVIRKDRFIDVDVNPLNIGLYEVIEEEYHNKAEFEEILNNFKEFKLKDDRCLLTTIEHEAYYKCMDNNSIICEDIKREVGNRMLYSLFRK